MSCRILYQIPNIHIVPKLDCCTKKICLVTSINSHTKLLFSKNNSHTHTPMFLIMKVMFIRCWDLVHLVTHQNTFEHRNKTQYYTHGGEIHRTLQTRMIVNHVCL